MTLRYGLKFYLVNWRLLVRSLLSGRRVRITVGAHTYGVPRIRWWGEASGLTIGKYCSIAREVTIFLGGNHRVDWITTFPFNVIAPWNKSVRNKEHPWSRGDVKVGNDVWIGEGCTILSGVSVGDGSVIAARAVVSRDVPPYSIVVGNPGRVVRQRFDASEVEYLLSTRWWDWDEKRIQAELETLLSPRIKDLGCGSHKSHSSGK